MDSVLIGGLMDPVTGLLGGFIEEWNLDRSCVAAFDVNENFRFRVEALWENLAFIEISLPPMDPIHPTHPCFASNNTI